VKTAGGFVTCVALLIALLVVFMSTVSIPVGGPSMRESISVALWHYRALDLVGQLLMVLAGTFGVLVLVKERIER